MNKIKSFAITFAFALALAFTFSCSSDDSSDNNSSGSGASSGGGASSPSGGNVESVTIGTQIWMKKNLNVEVSGSKCYDDLPANCETYGRLYTWDMAKTACPNGWKLPDTTDYKNLIAYVESQNDCPDCAGKYLKSDSDWSENGNGLDSYSFGGVAGGSYGHLDEEADKFSDIGNFGYYWTATVKSDNGYGISMRISYNHDYARWYSNYKYYLYSVRCIKN